MYQSLESLILKAAKKSDYIDELKIVTELYGSDIDENNLRTQLRTVAGNIKGSVTDIFHVRSYLNGLNSAELVLLSEVVKLM